ncbi:MAG: molybdopterin-guanine dinucleotide biosynthesis protein A [Alphaproteobacteria bacterium]
MIRLVASIALAIALASAASAADDRHAGYYYPQAETEETYAARAEPLADASRRHRIGFVTNVTLEMLVRPYPPPFAVFAKGEEAEKLIIVALRDGALDTVYRARAQLAMLTASARVSDYFKEHRVDDLYTFFDLARLLGFTEITVSDGQSFAHRILLQ